MDAIIAKVKTFLTAPLFGVPTGVVLAVVGAAAYFLLGKKKRGSRRGW